MSLTTTISNSITSLVTIATNTIALALGGLLCIFVSIVLAESIQKLSEFLFSQQTTQQPSREKAATSDTKPATNNSLETSAVRGVTGSLAFFGYFISIVIKLSQNETISKDESLPAVALGACIMVTGIAIGLAVTAAIGMGMAKMVDRL